ncbi:MAG: virulence protein [Oscillospiraceae bacterium]
MTINFNCTGAERKKLVTAISEITQAKAKYLGAPSFAYEVDYFTIDKNGTLTADGSISSETNSRLIKALNECGFIGEVANRGDLDEPAENSEVDGLIISIPRDSFTDTALDNLYRLVDAKGSLIRKALGTDALLIEETDETISFLWFKGEPTAKEAKAYTHFISTICEMARNQKRVTAKEKETDNDKYAFRCFLLRLGFIGSEFKDERKILLRNLTGSSAFKGEQKPKEVDICE